MRGRLNLFFRAVLFAFTAATFAAMATGADRPALQPFPRDCVWGDGVVEISEYGRPPIEEDFELLMG